MFAVAITLTRRIIRRYGGVTCRDDQLSCRAATDVLLARRLHDPALLGFESHSIESCDRDALVGTNEDLGNVPSCIRVKEGSVASRSCIRNCLQLEHAPVAPCPKPP